LSGTPIFIRSVQAINFDWSVGSPAPQRVNAARFSVRWTDILRLEPGHHRFTMTADDGVRLHIDDRTVIDEFVVRSASQYFAGVTLVDD